MKSKPIQERIQNALEIALIAELLTLPAGYEISFHSLAVYRLENGSFAVDPNAFDERPKRERLYKEFRDPVQAARYFEQLRKKYKLGFDYETKRSRR